MEAHYNCSAEWHFAHLHGRGKFFAAALYSFAFHLSKKTGKFYASIPNLADYFGVTERTVRHALRQLEKTGFLAVLSKRTGRSVEYRPVPHKEWNATHGGSNCVTKGAEQPWTNEPADVLGRQIYAVSAGRFKVYRNYVKSLRLIGKPWAGATDEDILRYFKDFLPTYVPKDTRHWAQGLCSKFKAYVWERHMPTLRAARAAHMAQVEAGKV